MRSLRILRSQARAPLKIDQIVNVHTPFLSMREAVSIESEIVCYQRETDRSIIIDIRCPGGSVSALKHLRSVISASEVPIFSRASGTCAGVAFVLWQSCIKRWATVGSTFRIYNPGRVMRFLICANDPFEEVRRVALAKAMHNLQLAQREMRTVANILHRRNPHISVMRFRQMMAEDKTYSLDEMVELGLIDTVVRLGPHASA